MQSRRGLLGCTGEEVKDRGRRYKPFEVQRDVHLQVHREYSCREITRDKSRRPRPDFTALASLPDEHIGKNLFARKNGLPEIRGMLDSFKIGNENAKIYARMHECYSIIVSR